MILLYRVLPFLSSVAVAVALFVQFGRPFDYPWIAVIGILTVPVVAFFMARRRVSLSDLMEKMLPTALLLGALVFAILLSESSIQFWIIVALGAVATFLSLELLFFYIFMPSRYPVQGLSRVNIAYVPIIVWYTTATSVGLLAFLHSDAWLHVAGMVALGAVLFRTTGHPEATPEQNRRWTAIGAVVGAHLGLLGIMLPLTMMTQGALAAVIFCGVLRMRRFLYRPTLSRSQAWFEAAVCLILIIVLLTTTRWL